MVFSSVPVYLDPPNWNQQQNLQQGGGNDNLHLPSTILPPPQLGGGGGGAASIRPGSMPEQARIAKVPLQPETPLKCPRCDSTNTKFCYFNNYSLSQPRHFCKTCRRYWTRGGSLRNVPVGGGCRRNKKTSKRSRSKSPVKTTSSSSSLSPINFYNNSTTDHHQVLGYLSPGLSQLPLLQNLGAYGSEFQIGASSSTEQCSFLGTPKVHNNGLAMAGAEGFIGLSPSCYIDQHNGVNGVRDCSEPVLVPMTKVEENQGLNLPKGFLGISSNDHIWGTTGNTWTDLPGFTSSV